MKSTKLDAYRGPLDCAQAAEGINAANANARRLAADAQTLLDAGSYASAVSLAALAIEESGKVSILRAIVLAEDEQSLKLEWKRYRSHTSKNCHWIFADLVAKGAKIRSMTMPRTIRTSWIKSSSWAFTRTAWGYGLIGHYPQKSST